jgi:hypothetical protein
MRRISFVAAALFALAACTAFDPQMQQLTEVDGIVADALQAARASAGEQKAALARAERAFQAQASNVNRARLATLLATLPDPLRNDARAAELLASLSDPNDPGIGRFAALLRGQVVERERLVREAREHERTDKERDKREEALRQQLDALRGIERGIREREERLRRRDN